ncbi:sugar transferase [Ktedonobacter racemifer]|nr:sugar transferase [Ktedonobacter racemifer]
MKASIKVYVGGDQGMVNQSVYSTLNYGQSQLLMSFIALHDMQWQKARVSRVYHMTKRALDITGALCGLALLGIALVFVGILMYCEDPGPLFYKQKRVGRYGKPFYLYKLRTMIVNADEYLKQHPALLAEWQMNGKLQNDPRITRIGRFLRRTSLDELPQMLNVLRGDMSLVGPRAIQFSEIEAFSELFALRQMVKPGLTGLWQVSGRSMTSYEQRNILDCTYVLECSLRMDLQILIKTLPVVLNGDGAF